MKNGLGRVAASLKYMHGSLLAQKQGSNFNSRDVKEFPCWASAINSSWQANELYEPGKPVKALQNSHEKFTCLAVTKALSLWLMSRISACSSQQLTTRIREQTR